MKLYPLGIQTFSDLREGENFHYVDKTAVIHKLLATKIKSVFLSRPRRFGKSLLCSTFDSLFGGRRELFKDLAIDNLEWDWKVHPVVRITLNQNNYSKDYEETPATLTAELKSSADRYGLSLQEGSSAIKFKFLLQDLYKKFGEKAAIIIDEYDKPLLDAFDNKELHEQVRNHLHGFYSVIKGADEFIRFAFMTGVTKFAKTSVFSGLNQFTDISLNPDYADIVGFTQEEVESEFAEDIDSVVEGGRWAENGGHEAYLKRLKSFYNGYRFSEKPLTVYNPWGIHSHYMNKGDFIPYWYETGSPTFLIKLVEKDKIDLLEVKNLRVNYYDFAKYNLDDMKAVPLLYQSGYLTIKDYDDEIRAYSLDYPNVEVESAFTDSLSTMYLKINSENKDALVTKLPDFLMDGDIKGAIEAALIPFFAGVPYDIISAKVKTDEKYYQLLLYIIFKTLGLHIDSEVCIAAGRADAIVETRKFCYCFEFKVKGTVVAALKQIDSKDYLTPYKGTGKQLFKVGIVFDTKKRNVGKWKAEIVGA